MKLFSLKNGLTFAGRLEHTSGGPAGTKGFSSIDGVTNWRSPRGTDPGTCAGDQPGQGNFSPWSTVCGNNINLISEIRLPPTTIVDLQVYFDLYALLHQHIALSFEILEIFNERLPSSLHTSDATIGNFGYRNATGGWPQYTHRRPLGLLAHADAPRPTLWPRRPALWLP
jgi:hypothetical protein